LNDLDSLSALGLTWPSPAYLIGMVLFSIVGYPAWRWGKKHENAHVKWLGIALMLYPYGVSETWMLWAVGCLLCLAVYWYGKAGR
jgi:hypothetical protein